MFVSSNVVAVLVILFFLLTIQDKKLEAFKFYKNDCIKRMHVLIFSNVYGEDKMIVEVTQGINNKQ